MNWSKAKTILIVFLLCTGGILLSMLVNSTIKSNNISPETVAHAVQLLNSRAIKVDTALIPTTLKTERMYTVENVISDYATFADIIFPTGCTSASDNDYFTDTAKLTFDGDSFSISSTVGIPTDDKLKAPSEKAAAYLLDLGIDVSDAVTEVSNDSKGLFTVCFTKKLGGLPLFDCKINVELLGTSIVNVSGCWFNKIDAASPMSKLESVPGLLVKFASENSDFTNLEITGLAPGFAINESGVFHMKATVLPVYEILCSDGRKFYVDARG